MSFNDILATLEGVAKSSPAIMLMAARQEAPAFMKSITNAVGATLVTAIITALATAYVTQVAMREQLAQVTKTLTDLRADLRRVDDKVESNDAKTQEWIRHHLETENRRSTSLRTTSEIQVK